MEDGKSQGGKLRENFKENPELFELATPMARKAAFAGCGQLPGYRRISALISLGPVSGQRRSCRHRLHVAISMDTSSHPQTAQALSQ
jgi:hypothetical protein